MPTKVQTVIFSKSEGDWTVESARSWLSEHDLSGGDVDETDSSWRFRQFEPSRCKEDSFVTLTRDLPAGVTMVACEVTQEAACAFDASASQTRDLIRAAMSVARSASEVFRNSVCFDELTKAGRVVERRLPDGSCLHVCEGVSAAALRTFDAEAGVVTVVASDGSVNRYGDVDDPDGWITEHYEKNPVILVDHSYLMESIVGVSLRTWPADGRFWQVQKLDPPDEASPPSKLLRAKLSAGSARTVSTSFLPLRVEKIRDQEGEWNGSYNFREKELLEVSWVPVPANRNATIVEPIQADEREISKEHASKLRSLERITRLVAMSDSLEVR